MLGLVQGYTRIVHQQYWSKDASTWPPEWRDLSRFWSVRDPSDSSRSDQWSYHFWTDDTEAKLFKEELPEFEELYHWIPQCLDAKISQADLSAYAILYIYGGIYADMDTMPLVNLDALMEAAVAMAQRSDLVLLPSIRRPDEDEVRGIGGSEEPYSLDTDLMVSTQPRHPFFLETLRSIRAYVTEHNQTVCGRDRRTPTYDLMFLTAWGRLSMCARSWTEDGMNHSQLQFLESLFLRDPVDASFAYLALHVLAHQPVEVLQQSPPPTSGKALDRWVQRMESRKSVRQPVSLQVLEYGEVQVLFQAPDLILAPIAASPVYEKRILRQLHLTCGDNSSCFLENVSTVVQQQFKERKVQRNWMLVFNDDGGIWEGSWNQEEQEVFNRQANASHASSNWKLRTDL